MQKEKTKRTGHMKVLKYRKKGGHNEGPQSIKK
jgi:hypothetical protein